MSLHPQNRTLIFILIALLAANLIFMGTQFFMKGKRSGNNERKGMLTDFLKEEVKFSGAQMVAYDSLRMHHREEGKSSFEEMRNKKREMFKSLGQSQFADTAIAAAAEVSAQNQRAMETRFLNNLKEIRNIGTPGQRAIFDTGFYRSFERRSHK